MNKICEFCGKEYDTKHVVSKYCSIQCYWKSMKGKSAHNKGKPIDEWMSKEKQISRAEKISKTKKEGYRLGKYKINKELCAYWEGKKFSKEHKDNISKGNLGKKMKYKQPKKGNLTSFKKGQKPWNYIDGRSNFFGPGRYGDDWDKIRYLVYIRDKFTCQNCGIKRKSLDVHHKVPFLLSKDNSIDNLITLCRSCHMKIEQKWRRDNMNNKKLKQEIKAVNELRGDFLGR